MAVKLFELWMAGAVVVLLALVMMMLITELLGNSQWEEAEGGGEAGKSHRMESLGMEKSLSLLASLTGPGRRAQPVGKVVGMLGWIGEAMAQVLRKVGECARVRGRSLCVAPLCRVLVLHMMESSCLRVLCLAGQRAELLYPSFVPVKCEIPSHGWWLLGEGPALPGAGECLGTGCSSLLRSVLELPWESSGLGEQGWLRSGGADGGDLCLVTFPLCCSRALSKSSHVSIHSLLRVARAECFLGAPHHTPPEFPIF